MSMETPCSVMFDAFKNFGHISYKDLAYMILSDKKLYGGKSPRSRIEEKTWLSRYVVRAEFGVLPVEYFVDFGIGARDVVNTLRSKNASGLSDKEILEYFTGQGAADMAAVLEATHQNRALYENFVNHIVSMDTDRDVDRIELLILHYLIVGCTGNPSTATSDTLQFAKQKLGMQFKTSIPSHVENPEEAPTEDIQLALIRIIDNKIKGDPYKLYDGPEGTEIGSLCTSEHAINDVEPTVSGQHLHIWRDENGHWLVEGLASKNGSTLISGVDKSVTVIEPPRSERSGFVSSPVEIAPSDVLVLAQDTVFMVMQTV